MSSEITMSDLIKLEVTGEELNTIGAALSELPFKIANPLINKLTSQYAQHTERAQKEAELNKVAEDLAK